MTLSPHISRPDTKGFPPSLRWHCHSTFHHMPPEGTGGGIAIVIDVLRASTTIVTALTHGALGVRPALSIEEARVAAATPRPGPPGTLLGGERGGIKIEGFDLGNSPLDYTPDRVTGRWIVITTTNGTAAIDACRNSSVIFVGALVNRLAVVRLARATAISRDIRDIHLVCAGTDGEVTEEDLLAAGAMLWAASMEAPSSDHDILDTASHTAIARYCALIKEGPDGSYAAIKQALLTALQASIGGRNLVALGMDRDLPAAAAIDSLAVVPILDHETGWLIAAGGGGA